MVKRVFASAGIEATYRAKLTSWIKAMSDDVIRRLQRQYEDQENRIAFDASPAEVLKRVVNDMRKTWQKKFDDLAPKLADYFAKEANARTDSALKKMLKDAGWTVKFRMSPAMTDILDATVNANVALIKSIPSEYFTQIEGMVARSVQAGRDLKQLSDNLREHFGVTKRRAALIARDQNNKATSALSHARQRELGLEDAVWMHSHAGRKPRPTHVKMNGKKYKISKGMWDPAEKRYVFPGELINCRCAHRPVIPGFK